MHTAKSESPSRIATPARLSVTDSRQADRFPSGCGLESGTTSFLLALPMLERRKGMVALLEIHIGSISSEVGPVGGSYGSKVPIRVASELDHHT